jgi:hypothetical protein
MTEMLMYATLSDTLIVVYVLSVIMLIEVCKVTSQKLKCLYSNTTTIVLDWTILAAVDVSLLHSYCTRNTLCSASRCALRLRYIDLAVGIKVAVEVCCCLTIFSC